jgi:predicted phage terminase large subunit-like protein
MAHQFGGTVKTTLEDNDVHRAVFPEAPCRPDPARGWSTDGLYLAGTPTGSKDPAYRALGYGASVIGARAHGVILDDPLTQEQARSPVEQEKAKRYHDMTVDSRLHPDGWALAIMTRWHDLDLAAHLAAKDEWAVLTMPALDEAGEALWPERFPASWLEAKRREIGGPLFQAIYQADPTGLGGEVFKAASWFRPLPPGFDRRSLTRVVQFWDLAFSEKDTADYTVGLTLGRDGSGNLYVLGLHRSRVGQAQLLNTIASQVHLHRPAVVGVEEAAYRAPVTKDVVGRLLRGGLPCHVQAVKPVTDKVMRARLPAGRAEAGMLYADRGAPWFEEMVAECLGFPNTAHDDQVDALSGATQLALEWRGPREPVPVVFGDR